ncbi:hypothetical protein IWX50DRAFT_436539, partial [Phyllosticta citricarpa]
RHRLENAFSLSRHTPRAERRRATSTENSPRLPEAHRPALPHHLHRIRSVRPMTKTQGSPQRFFSPPSPTLLIHKGTCWGGNFQFLPSKSRALDVPILSYRRNNLATTRNLSKPHTTTDRLVEYHTSGVADTGMKYVCTYARSEGVPPDQGRGRRKRRRARGGDGGGGGGGDGNNLVFDTRDTFLASNHNVSATTNGRVPKRYPKKIMPSSGYTAAANPYPEQRASCLLVCCPSTVGVEKK